MRRSVAAVVGCVLMLCALGASAEDTVIVLPGRFNRQTNECRCPVKPQTCKCVIYLTTTYDLYSRADNRSSGLYQSLVGLDSFEGEDEDFLYFRGTAVEGTEPPIFDIKVRGDALVKISKKHLEQYLMSAD